MNHDIKPRSTTEIKPDQVRPQVTHANDISVDDRTEWGPRQIPDLELIWIKKGVWELSYQDGESVQAKMDEVLVIFPGRTHVFRHVSGGKQISCVHLEPVDGKSWLAREYTLAPYPQNITNISQEPDIGQIFEKLAKTMLIHHPYRQGLLNAIAQELWMKLSVHWNLSTTGVMSSRMEEMLTWLIQHLEQNISRRDLAKAFHLSPEHINSLFKRELGISPTDFIHQERCRRAYGLLRQEGLSVAQAAQRCGYDDPFYFSKRFKALYNFPPSHFQRPKKGSSHSKRDGL